MHDLNISKWQMAKKKKKKTVKQGRQGKGCVLEWEMACLVFKITFPLKTFTSSVSLPLLSCYWKIALHKSGGKPFDAGPVCISHTLTHTHTENTFHPPYPKPPVARAGICDPNPYFNFSPLMQTNSILVASPQKRRATWEMSLFSCCIYKGPNQRHFWAVPLSMSIMSKQASTKAEPWRRHNSSLCRADFLPLLQAPFPGYLQPHQIIHKTPHEPV